MGNWIDGKAGSFPWGTIIGVALGFVAAAREMVRIARIIQSDDKRK